MFLRSHYRHFNGYLAQQPYRVHGSILPEFSVPSNLLFFLRDYSIMNDCRLQHNCSILYDCSILFQDCSIPLDCSILQDCSNLKNLYILHNCSIPLLSLVVGKTFIIGEFQGPKTLQSGPIFQVPKTLLSGDFQGSKTLLSGDGIYMSPPVVQEAMIKISYIHGIFHSSKTPPPPQL